MDRRRCPGVRGCPRVGLAVGPRALPRAYATTLTPALCPRSDWDNANRKKELAGWDQFTVNEQKFGVKTTYDETFYTTALDKSKVSREAEERAKKIAAEIEGTATDNVHIAEERGHQLQTDGAYDEEARYSTVLRGKEAGAHLRGAAAPSAAAPASAKDAAPVTEPARSKLNPNAKAFVMNPNAKAFVPSTMPSMQAQAAQMQPAPGQYPGGMPAAYGGMAGVVRAAWAARGRPLLTARPPPCHPLPFLPSPHPPCVADGRGRVRHGRQHGHGRGPGCPGGRRRALPGYDAAWYARMLLSRPAPRRAD